MHLSSPLPTDVQAQVSAALDACDRSDHAAIDRFGAEAAAAAAQAGRIDLQCSVLAGWSQSAYRRNDFALATRLAVQALEAGQHSQQPAAHAEGLVAWARVLWSSGELDDALSALEQAMPLTQQHGSPRLQLHAFNLMGLVHADLGQLDESMTYQQAALRAAEASGVGDLQLIARTNLAGRWLQLGKRHAAAGQHSQADVAWKQVMAMYPDTEALVQQYQLQHGLPHFLVSYATTLLRLGRVPEAMAVFERQRTIVDAFPDRSSMPHAALHLANHYRRQGYLVSARKAVQEGLAEAEKLGSKARQADLHLQVSEIAEMQGSFEVALAHHKRFHALREECALERAQMKSMLLAVRLRTEQWARQAHVDALTGLDNRRSLEVQLQRLHTQARTVLTPLHAAMIDVDHFKAINDCLGHAGGDDVLRKMGLLLRAQCREGDIAARYGGEEFVVLLPGSDPSAALRTAERLRLAVQGHEWPALPQGLRVTISVGLADLANEAEVELGLQRADRALYAAKAQGRNRVCVA